MRKTLAVLPLAAVALIGFASPVLAQEIENADTAIAPVATMKLSAFLVLVLVSFLIPLATGLLTKANASATVKQVVTLILAAAHGVLQTNVQADGTAIISATTAQYALLSLGIAIVSYLGIYRPHDANGSLAPDVGFGGYDTTPGD